MEIGGYIEFPQFVGGLLHEEAIPLNSARNCLAYLIESRHIKKIALPKFLCASVENICRKYGLEIYYYSIGMNFMPKDLNIGNDVWLYMVNYYGQINNQKIKEIKAVHDCLIIDNVQAYFQMPVHDVDTIYTCRKYFGVPDGAFLYTDAVISRTLEQDKSAKRMKHLLGRFEDSAGEYYSAYTDNEENFEHLPVRKMSKITQNILRGIDYEMVKSVRMKNFMYLDAKLKSVNKLLLEPPDGAFMYPLYLSNGEIIRKKLQLKKIYIPTLWPDVFDICNENELEYDMAKNILPLPCDQRYGIKEMAILVDELLNM